MKLMNWSIIALLFPLAIIMGILAVKGFTHGIEPYLWLCFGIAAAIVVSKNIDDKIFVNALLIGLSWGIINGVIQSSFFNLYLTNNPSLVKNFDKVTFMPQRYFPLVTGPVMGLVTGLLIGGLSLFLKRLW
jgi:hypothetical protein